MPKRSKTTVDIHCHWTKIIVEDANDPGYGKMQCNYCPNVQNWHPEKCRTHLIKACKGFLDGPQKTALINKKKKKQGEDVSSTVVQVGNASRSADISGLGGKLTEYILRGKASPAELDRELALAIFTGFVPFNFIENPWFLNFFKCFPCNYVPPNRKRLGGALLNEAFEIVDKAVTNEMNEAFSYAYEIDGWSNVRCQPVVNIMSVLESGPVLLER